METDDLPVAVFGPFPCFHSTCDPSSSDPGEPGGGASEGGGGAAEPVSGPQSGGEGLRGGGRPAHQRGEQVQPTAGAAEAEAREPDGLARDPPVQPRRGGRDRKSSLTSDPCNIAHRWMDLL